MRPSQTSAMRAGRARVVMIPAALVALALSLGPCPAALAAAPAPCGGAAQISDAGADGHHTNTDVLSAWFSEDDGRLQAVIKVTTGDWRPMHVDSDAAGWAMLFDAGGSTRYVRLLALKTGTLQYDYGTWTLAGGFVSAAATTGEVAPGAGGTVTIDVPAETGAVAGARLEHPFVLTYEHDPAAADPYHWVDHAPGGVTPDEALFGADFVVGSCQPAAPAGPGGGGATPVEGAGAPQGTTSVVLNARRELVGPGRVLASGHVVPARGGLTVRVVVLASRSSKPPVVRFASTRADGSFAVSIPVSESSSISARGDGINAQTLVITVRSTIRMRLRRLRNGKTVVSGRVRPLLPGRILLLRTNAAIPAATAWARHGRFRFPARRLTRGRYQAVFIPSGNRAERSTSATGVIR